MSEQLKRLETFLTREDISAWQRNYTESILKQLKEKGRISQRQWSVFQENEARYAPEVIAARQEWNSQWDDEKAYNLKIAANYYKHYRSPQTGQRYFQKAVERILEDESYIPTQKQYNAMVKNKFVTKILETMKAEPKYEVGSLVQVRRTASKGAYKLRDRVAMVVSNDGPVLSAANGAKTYTILPFGESQTVEIQERYLKRKRG